MKYLFFTFFLTTLTHAYTFNNNFGASFKNNEVAVYIDIDTTCDQIGITNDELASMVKSASSKFWNKVPTSNLQLVPSGFLAHTNNINDGILCSPTDDTCITNAGADAIPAINEIIIACNDRSDNFTSGVLAVTVPNKFDGNKIAGSVIILNDTAGTGLANLSNSDKIAVIAHELGHAIGLGHSDDKAALMYYRTVNLRKSLGQDDVDGVSFLYPMRIDGMGLLGGCGIVTDGNNPPKDPPFWQMGITFGVVILIFEFLKLLRRSKTRSAA